MILIDRSSFMLYSIQAGVRVIHSVCYSFEFCSFWWCSVLLHCSLLFWVILNHCCSNFILLLFQLFLFCSRLLLFYSVMTKRYVLLFIRVVVLLCSFILPIISKFSVCVNSPFVLHLLNFLLFHFILLTMLLTNVLFPFVVCLLLIRPFIHSLLFHWWALLFPFC